MPRSSRSSEDSRSSSSVDQHVVPFGTTPTPLLPFLDIAFDCYRRETRCPFDRTNLIGPCVAPRTGVDLQRTEFFAALRKDARGKESMQPEECRISRDFGGAFHIVLGEGNTRTYVAYLAIQSGADLI